MVRSVGGSDQPSVRPGGPSRGVAILVSLIPVWTVLGLSLLRSSFLDPVFANPPGLLGLPFGIVLLGVALAWTAFGALVVARADSAAGRSRALAIFAIPASVLVLASPWIVGVMQDA